MVILHSYIGRCSVVSSTVPRRLLDLLGFTADVFLYVVMGLISIFHFHEDGKSCHFHFHAIALI